MDPEKQLTVGSLFSGIGGLDLGLERAGMVVKWQVENDKYCQRVLKKHWPNVRLYDDVRTVGEELEAVDLICGGFPCQDVSVAGKRAGIAEGTRSGLWIEFARIVRLLRPRYVLVENVPGLLNRGFGRVLGDLAACGYDAEWACLSAFCQSLPHLRERLFIVAHPRANRRKLLSCDHKDRGKARAERSSVTCESHLGAWNRPEIPPPEHLRVDNGIPSDVDAIRALGNAVVPAVAQWIGERIIHWNEDDYHNEPR